MSFFNPLWFFAVAAVAIPVMIHLWNIRSGKTLKVGSISLVETTSRKRSRSLNLLDLLLLFLRCLLLVLIAFFLAKPYLKQTLANEQSKGWLLIPKENFKEAYAKFKPKADSLLKAGYKFRYFNSGFQKMAFDKAALDTSKQFNTPAIPYWNLLQQLDQLTNTSVPVTIITPGLVKNFGANKPQVGLKLNWQTYTPADSVNTWIQSAWFTANKDVHVVQGVSKPTGTIYSTVDVNSGSQQSSPYIIDVTKGKPTVSLKNNEQKPVAIDTETIKIEIYSDAHSPDAGYVHAALDAAAKFTQRNLTVMPYANGVAKKDWLFWLSAKPLDKAIAGHYKNVFEYADGKAVAKSSWITDGGQYAVEQGQQLISLSKLVAAKSDQHEIIWHDGFGDAVLSRGITDSTSVYHFYSRFDPSWNDLVWNANFPKMMLNVLLGDGNSQMAKAYDRRIIDPKQLQPEFIKEAAVKTANTAIEKDLTPWFWFAAIMVFFTERLLTHLKVSRRKGGLANA